MTAPDFTEVAEAINICPLEPLTSLVAAFAGVAIAQARKATINVARTLLIERTVRVVAFCVIRQKDQTC